MKKYTIEMMKLLAIIIVTPLLVAAYTKIEKSVSATPAEQTQGGITGVTPVSIGLVNKEKSTDAAINPMKNSDYIWIRSIQPVNKLEWNEKGLYQPSLTSNRFALVVL